jgi:hypothetical protein
MVPQDGVEPLEALDGQAPDAVILDLAPDGPVSMETLAEIRDNRLYTGLPTFVLIDDPSPEVRDRLQDLMTITVPRRDPVAALDELLGLLFPVAEIAEQRG